MSCINTINDFTNTNNIESIEHVGHNCNTIFNNDTSIVYYRADNYNYNKFENSLGDIRDTENSVTNFNNVNIFRYKFSDDFKDELFKFSKIHQYDHRKDFKAAWELWTEQNNDLINIESRRLTNLGYNGDDKDIIDKMFKSARYYFRKKSTEKKKPIKRRIYIGTQRDLLDAMDDHINAGIIMPDFKPSEGFEEFCKKNLDLIKEQVNILCRTGFNDPNEIKSKIKKTYKNRYFFILHS